MNFFFHQYKPTPLCKIMGDNKSDKGAYDIKNSQHNYTTFYYSIFDKIKNDNLRLFELGLGTNNVNVQSNMGPNGRPGASLYGWSEFFPNSKIYGADIDKGVLFNTDRIKTFYCDQTNPYKIKQLWNIDELKEDFDIIIEDGLHTYDANVCFLENSIHKLKVNGYYIVEDILSSDINLFNKKIEEWKILFPNLIFTLLRIPSYVNNFDNNLLVVYRQR